MPDTSTPIDQDPRTVDHVSRREGSNTWVTAPGLLSAWRHESPREAISSARPVTLEWAVGLACNQACAECPYRFSRRAAGCSRPLPVGEFATPDDRLVASLDGARRILQRSAEGGVRGVIFTGGGEPCIVPDLPEMIRHSATLGMVNGLYTNGIQIGVHPTLASEIVRPENRLRFVRVSLNTATPATAARFSGISEETLEAQFEALALLLRAREARFGPRRGGTARRPAIQVPAIQVPAIQVSVIVDRRNVGDLPVLGRRVARIYRDHAGSAAGSHDAIVVRPLTRFGGSAFSVEDHAPEVIRGILTAFGAGTETRDVLENSGVSVALGFGLDRVDEGAAASYAEVVREEYVRRDRCWANGLFLTVGPDGTVYLCCDRNCDPDSAIGSLRESSIEEIYRGEARRRWLDRVERAHCGPEVCEATCRTSRLNEIARALRRGDLTEEQIAAIARAAVNEPRLLLS